MKIVIAVPTLSLGGAERLAALQARELALRGHEVTLMVVYRAAQFYPAPPHAKTIFLNLTPACGPAGKAKNLLSIIKTLFKERPGALLCHMLTNTALAGILCGFKTIFIEHADLSKTPNTFIKTFVCNHARAVVLLQEEDKKFFALSGLRAPCFVIHNPAIAPPSGPRPLFLQQQNNALACGRLVKEKGFDILLEAWAMTIAKHPSWRLTIAGEGPERKNLEGIIKRLNLQGAVTLAGQYADMGALYRNADIFLMPSRTEGFPLALCEAMACGMPPVVFGCAGRMNIILQHNSNGIIAEQSTPEAFSSAVNNLIENPQKRAALGKEAAGITRRFSAERYIDAFENLLKQLKIS